MSHKPDDTLLDIGITSRKKVLVAEDEQNIASLLEDWLSEAFEVILAHNGAAAFQKAKWNKPDVILLDVMMPDMGGYEVVCALQGDPVTAKTPVIVMTAKNFDDSTIKLIKAEPNVYGFLNKPFKPDELKKQILQVMSGQRTFAATPSRRPAGSAPAAAPAPAAPTPAPMPIPQVPPTPAAVLPPAPPPAPMAIPQVPPTPAVVLPPPPRPAAPPPPPPAPMPEVSHGFPEIIPTSPIPSAPAAAAPLPPFLKPSHMPPATPPPAPPRAAPPAPPPPPAQKAPPPAQNPMIEPISALPPEPMEPPPLASMPPPMMEMPAPMPPPSAPARLSPRMKASPQVPHDADDVGAGSAATLRFAFWACKAVAKVGIFLAGVLFAGETACRWTEKALGTEVFVPRFRPSRTADLPYLMPASGGWTLGGIEYSTNEWGTRGNKVALLKPPNTVRIVLLGGSALFGENLPSANTVAGQLAAMLKGEKGRFDVEVVNGGVWGYSPEEQWTFYESEMAQLKPDAVVWLVEDRLRGFPTSVKLREMAQDSWLASGMFKNSHLARLMMRRELEEGAGSVRKTDFLAALQPALKVTREDDIAFLYAVFPDGELTGTEWRELPDAQRIDVDESVRRDYLLRTSSSQRAVASAVFERIQSMKLSPSARKN